MREWLDKVRQLAVMVPVVLAILTAVKRAVEEFEQPGNGPAKKQAVLNVIAVLYDQFAEFMPLPKDKVLAIAERLVEVVVAAKNLIGEFVHSPQPQPAPTPTQ